MSRAKPFAISRKTVVQAWECVKSNGGAPGIDGQSIEDFEENLRDNLYKIWNRMSSGSYFASPVRMCEIPKADGGRRMLGIPTVADRVAQMVAKLYIEPRVEPLFHPDSYGYRPGRSAKDALGVTRKRCWKFNWVIDMDIKGFFDEIDHNQLMRAVEKHVKEKWLLLYIERWLKAPGRDMEGREYERTKGTPQGGVISPLLANLFLHYAFDMWMKKHFPRLPFERYADDIIVHCVSEKQAHYVLRCIRERLKECGLSLHPEKTKIVYCKDDNRREEKKNTAFDFLGYTFRARYIRSKYGNFFTGFTPAVSRRAMKAMSYTIRNWQLRRDTSLTLHELAEKVNPIVRGWMNYYGAFRGSALQPTLRQVEFAIARWAMRKYKKQHRKLVATLHWLEAVKKREPDLFAHWNWNIQTTGQ